MSFLKHLLPAWKTNLEDKTKANAAILSAIDIELTNTEEATIQSKLMLSLDTATGEWLDRYGSLFGVIRRDKEEDDVYRQRIINYVLLKRGTIPALLDAIREFLNDYVSYIEIYEPYTNIFYLNKSKLDGVDHIQGKYYTTAVIDIKFSKPFPPDIMDIINEFKPAGVTVLLTYRPGYNNPDAPIIVLGDDIVTNYTKLSIWNGLIDRIRGHVNLTARSRTEEDESGIFHTNNSDLNSLDRLAGSFSASNPSYNLASYSAHNLVFDNKTKVPDVLSKTEAVSPDFYTRTGAIDGQYAIQSMDASRSDYLYFTLDIATYFRLNYSKYLREVQPDGIYTKDTYVSLMKKPYIQYSMSALLSVSKPSGYIVQILNLSTGSWDSLESGMVSVSGVEGNVKIDSMKNYVSDEGIVFTRLEIPYSRGPVVEGGSFDQNDYDLEINGGSFTGYDKVLDGNVKIDSMKNYMYRGPVVEGGSFDQNDYDLEINGGSFTGISYDKELDGNVSGEMFDLQIDFFELGFNTEVAIRPTINLKKTVTNRHSIIQSN
ncbi:baseplate protein [Bacillus phage SIOphi]|uniref:Baseplate protein n=1 Tax=Bacillus phage SIOphi TaxID=1285382 RepID=R4JKE9_9CAUD|nr:baseplate protein [Bacillus phage SIOphi]AGK87004.1 hypothetical protein SIOphi_00980 [Bacillus phage SIOphi]